MRRGTDVALMPGPLKLVRVRADSWRDVNYVSSNSASAPRQPIWVSCGVATLTGRRWLALLLTVAAGAWGVVPAVAAGKGNVKGTRHTQLASPPAGATAARANGVSANVAFSQDNRVARYMAYDSSASNLVSRDSNGRRDIFLFSRARAQGDLNGILSLVSRRSGARGRQANGDSAKPSLDGDLRHRPHCVVFQSRATNLDPRDRSRDWDVYLRELRRNRTTLLSTGSWNAKNAVVDGRCELVSYETREQ